MNDQTRVDDLASVDVEELVGLVWGAVLDRPVLGAPAPAQTEGLITAAVELIGDWPGSIEVAAPQALADLAAMALFDIDNAAVNDADRRDALAELTNMTGGNLKALVAGSNHLGLPVVAPGAPGLDERHDSRCWGFTVEQLTFVVRICEPLLERTP